MSNLLEVNDASFKAEVFDSPVPVLVDFFADWCPPCRAMVPILEELAEELGDRARTVKVNAPENPALAQRFSVSAVPTLIVLKSGEEVGRMVGMTSKRRLLKALGL